MVFNGGFETHGILRRFCNPWYLTEVLRGLRKQWGTLSPGMV